MNLGIKELNRHFEEDVIKKDDIIDLCLSEYSKATNDTEKLDFLILIARCFRSKKEPHYANDYLDKAINLKVKTAEALFWKGCIQNEFKNTDSAIALLDESIKTDASFDGSYQMLGVIYRQQGKFNDSKNYCLKALALNPENAKTHFGLAETLYSLKEYDLSEFHLRKAVALGLSFASNTLQTRFKIKTAQERSAYSDYFWDSYSNNVLGHI